MSSMTNSLTDYIVPAWHGPCHSYLRVTVKVSVVPPPSPPRSSNPLLRIPPCQPDPRSGLGGLGFQAGGVLKLTQRFVCAWTMPARVMYPHVSCARTCHMPARVICPHVSCARTCHVPARVMCPRIVSSCPSAGW